MSIDLVCEKLEFHKEWKISGFLTEEICELLLKKWYESDDRNTEHYRYSVFRSVLQASALSEKDFLTYISLCQKELDTVLFASPLIDLIKWPNLSVEQKRYLVEKESNFPEPAVKTINRWLKT